MQKQPNNLSKDDLEKCKKELLENFSEAKKRIKTAKEERLKRDLDFEPAVMYLSDHLIFVYRKIKEECKKALKKIEKGTYEKCSICGGNIEVECLKVYPRSTTCVFCKKKTEVA